MSKGPGTHCSVSPHWPQSRRQSCTVPSAVANWPFLLRSLGGHAGSSFSPTHLKSHDGLRVCGAGRVSIWIVADSYVAVAATVCGNDIDIACVRSALAVVFAVVFTVAVVVMVAVVVGVVVAVAVAVVDIPRRRVDAGWGASRLSTTECLRFVDETGRKGAASEWLNSFSFPSGPCSNYLHRRSMDPECQGGRSEVKKGRESAVFRLLKNGKEPEDIYYVDDMKGNRLTLHRARWVWADCVLALHKMVPRDLQRLCDCGIHIPT